MVSHACAAPQKDEHELEVYIAQTLEEINQYDVRGTKTGTSDKVKIHSGRNNQNSFRPHKISDAGEARSGQGYHSLSKDEIYVQF